MPAFSSAMAGTASRLITLHAPPTSAAAIAASSPRLSRARRITESVAVISAQPQIAPSREEAARSP